MEIVYLKNGQQANLVKKVDGQFLVAPYYTYNSYEGEEYSEAGTSLEMVTEVFKSPPLEKLHEEYKSVLERLEIAKKELSESQDLARQSNIKLRQTESQRTDLEKLIINRSDLRKAKTITIFPDKSFMPFSFPNTGYDGFKLSISLTVYNGEEQAWAYKLYKDRGDNYGHYLDLKAGILCDLTEEEIERVTIERIASKPVDYFSNQRIEQIDDKYLTEELKKVKANKIAYEKETSINKLNKEIADAQEKLKLLKARKGQVV